MACPSALQARLAQAVRRQFSVHTRRWVVHSHAGCAAWAAAAAARPWPRQACRFSSTAFGDDGSEAAPTEARHQATPQPQGDSSGDSDEGSDGSTMSAPAYQVKTAALVQHQRSLLPLTSVCCCLSRHHWTLCSFPSLPRRWWFSALCLRVVCEQPLMVMCTLLASIQVRYPPPSN